MAAALTEQLAAAADHQGRWEFGAAREILAGLVSAAGPADDSLELLTAKRMLAEVLRELDHTVEAHAIAAELVTACEARLGPAHPATVRATAVLAAILHDRAEPETEAGADDLARAEGLYLEVIAERAAGNDPADADPAGPRRASHAATRPTAIACASSVRSSSRSTSASIRLAVNSSSESSPGSASATRSARISRAAPNSHRPWWSAAAASSSVNAAAATVDTLACGYHLPHQENC